MDNESSNGSLSNVPNIPDNPAINGVSEHNRITNGAGPDQGDDSGSDILGKNVEDKEQLWNMVGFHRITGGFFYSYVLLIIGAIIGMITLPIITSFLPYPEIEGYKQMTATILGTWFGLMDFNLGGGGGFSDGLNRFIGQYADVDPKRSLKYIQFYVWFQMFTGIIQVTVLSIVVFTLIKYNPDLGFLSWFILAQTLVQYPGMLMIMESSLKSFQRGDKLAWLSWMQDTIFQVSVNIAFIIIGKKWGESNPAIGPLMGVAIFYILSQFMDDWINLIVGGFMFNKVLKERGVDLGVWNIFFPGFDKSVVKEALTFTGKQWIGNQIAGFINYFLTLYVLINMTGFASWKGLMLIPAFLAHLVEMVAPMGGSAVPAISEAYNNGKKELTLYFIHDLFKWFSFVTIYFAVSLTIITSKILRVAVGAFPALKNYEAGIQMIPIMMSIAVTTPYRQMWSRLFVACDQPLPPIFISYIVMPLSYGMKFLFIYLTITTETLPGWYFLILPDFITSMVAAIIGYVWYQKKVLRIRYKEIMWQVFGAPILAGVIYSGVLYFINYTIWPLLDVAMIPLGRSIVNGLHISGFSPEIMAKTIVAFGMLFGAIFIFPALLFSPIFAAVGGFDEFTLEEFRKTALVSGPSKFLVMSMYKITKFFHKFDVFQMGNRHPLADYDKVQHEIIELIESGQIHALAG